MIKAVLIINNHGKTRLSKFYEHFSVEDQQALIRECFQLVIKRSDRSCNFLESSGRFGKDTKIIYRRYATLFFIFLVDSSESELGILDLIQVFVETLNKCFEDVCELDLIFQVEKVHHVMDEVVMGGMVLETSLSDIVEAVDAQSKIEKKENPLSGIKDVIARVQR